MNKLKLTFIADTHHYSRTLGDCGPAYDRRSGSDQKCLAETGSIIDAAFEKIKNGGSDALMIIGDLSDDGERVSHLELIEKLHTFRKTVPVYVTLATHDWCCDNNARRYEGDSVFRDVDTVTSEELYELYKDFSVKNAADKYITHLGTASYCIEFPHKTVLFSLIDDQDGEGHSGFMPDHYEWILKRVRDYAAEGWLVIGMEHHLLFPHISPLLTDNGTCCKKHEKYLDDFASSGMRFIFVGHSHMQRIDRYKASNGNEIYEINVGSLVGYPAPIVDMTVTESDIDINMHCLESFCFDGKNLGQEYLKNHATGIIDNILRTARYGSKEDYVKFMREYSVPAKKAGRIRPVISLLAGYLEGATVENLGKKLNFITFGKAFRKADIKEMSDKKIIEIIHELFLNVLDGAIVRHRRGDSYYNIVSSFFTIPNRVVKKLHIKDEKAQRISLELIHLADEILTGGETDNHNLTVKR